MDIIAIENKAGKLKLNDAVHKDSMDRLLDEISKVFGAKAFAEGAVTGEITACIQNAADTLDIEIHSPGGNVLDGYKLYHAILELRSRGVFVTATINSLAASMASVIAMAADKIRMVKGGRMMIHEASQWIGGNAEDLKRAAQVLDEISAEIADIYAGKTGADPAEMRDLMKAETWMGADEALKRKFIDEVIPAKFDTPKKAKMSILDRLTSPSDAEAKARIEELENAAQAHDATLAELQGKVTAAEAALQEAATAAVELKTSLATATARVTELEVKSAADAAAITDLTEKAAFTENKVSTFAARMLAASGHSSPVDDPEAAKSDPKTLTRAEFSALSPADRNAHIRSGGKLTN